MKSSALISLSQISFEAKCRKYPQVPVDSIPPSSYNDSTANGLTKCIIDFLNYSGHWAERISNTGRVIDRRKSFTDSIGRSRTVGSIEWIKGSGTRGTADISAVIRGIATKIEVKIGKDRMSKEQKLYKESIERAGGIYIIASSFQEFYDWYTSNFSL